MNTRIGYLALLLVAFIITGCQQTTVRGPKGQRMTVAKPADVTLHRGEAESVTIALDRENFDGPVTVSISGLPSGVEAVDEPRSTTSESATVVLRASEHAGLVGNHMVDLTVEGPDGMRAREQFRVTVRE
jgi:hypothetical protein